MLTPGRFPLVRPASLLRGMTGQLAAGFPLVRALTAEDRVMEIRMELEKIPYKLTVCKVKDVSCINMNAEFYFVGKTDEELSLVCRTEDTPQDTTERDDGWRGFRIKGVLDFSLIGILSRISGILAEHEIGIFAVSTYNTDHILVKEENFERALNVLCAEGYSVK